MATITRFEDLEIKIMSFINYLQKSTFKGQRYKDTSLPNIEPQPSNGSK